MMIKEERFFDMMAKNIDKDEKSFEKTHIKTIKKAKKYLNPDDIVLDYGCATGSKTFEIANDVKWVHGIDISSKMIEIAKRRSMEGNIKNVTYSHATIFDERLKKESFDVILAFNVLHLLGDYKQAMHRIIHLLKPGGLFISVTPCLAEKMNFSNRLKFYLFIILMKLRVIPSIKRFKVTELVDSIAENLQIIESEKFYYIMTSSFIVAKKI